MAESTSDEEDINSSTPLGLNTPFLNTNPTIRDMLLYLGTLNAQESALVKESKRKVRHLKRIRDEIEVERNELWDEKEALETERDGAVADKEFMEIESTRLKDELTVAKAKLSLLSTFRPFAQRLLLRTREL
jgi:hypothetical protein